MRTSYDRVQQLRDLRAAIVAVTGYLEEIGQYTEAIHDYRINIAQVDELLRGHITQDALNQLADDVQPIIWLHKEWNPPSIDLGDGRYCDPPWFAKLDALHRRMMDCAFALRVVGER